MEKSFILAEFWGWYLILFFTIIMINTKRVKQMYEYVKDEKLLFIISLIAIIIGLINIMMHNLWTSDWRIIITLFGWIALLKGIIFFSYPKLVNQKILSYWLKWFPFLMVFMLFLGLYLLNKVYHFIIY
ncbi:MAG: hypothetical protein KGZ87_01605 [Bacteroidetes bacterium]|nr:hypothetical protein [Bacteroidota bacterium]